MDKQRQLQIAYNLQGTMQKKSDKIYLGYQTRYFKIEDNGKRLAWYDEKPVENQGYNKSIFTNKIQNILKVNDKNFTFEYQDESSNGGSRNSLLAGLDYVQNLVKNSTRVYDILVLDQDIDLWISSLKLLRDLKPNLIDQVGNVQEKKIGTQMSIQESIVIAPNKFQNQIIEESIAIPKNDFMVQTVQNQNLVNMERSQDLDTQADLKVKINNEWRDKYVKIKNQQIYCYAQKSDQFPFLKIELSKCEKAAYFKDNEFSIKIKNGCVYEFKAQTLEQQQRWLKIIENNLILLRDNNALQGNPNYNNVVDSMFSGSVHDSKRSSFAVQPNQGFRMGELKSQTSLNTETPLIQKLFCCCPSASKQSSQQPLL